MIVSSHNAQTALVPLSEFKISCTLNYRVSREESLGFPDSWYRLRTCAVSRPNSSHYPRRPPRRRRRRRRWSCAARRERTARAIMTLTFYTRRRRTPTCSSWSLFSVSLPNGAASPTKSDAPMTTRIWSKTRNFARRLANVTLNLPLITVLKRRRLGRPISKLWWPSLFQLHHISTNITMREK